MRFQGQTGGKKNGKAGERQGGREAGRKRVSLSLEREHAKCEGGHQRKGGQK